MKKIYNTAQTRSLRRWVRQLFSSWVKRQNRNCLAEIEKVMEMLREIEESIDIIARGIARQAKRDK